METQRRLAHLASFPERNPWPVLETDRVGNVVYCNAAAHEEFPDHDQFRENHPVLVSLQALLPELVRHPDTVVTLELPHRGRIYEHHASYISEVDRVRSGEKVIYLVEAHAAETILGYLRDDGLEPQPFLETGQLSILTPDSAYTRKGTFAPDRMIELLAAATDQALAEGHSALRVTGEMTWALRGPPGAERLIECEAKLGRNWFDACIPEEGQTEVRAVFDALMAGECEPVERYENPVVTRTGEERLIAWRNALLRDDGGNPIGTLSSGVDITERKRAEERAAHLTQVFRAIRNVNQLTTHEKDPDALLQQACELITDTRGYQTAWIARFDMEGRPVGLGHAGLGERSAELAELLDRGELPLCGRQRDRVPGVALLATGVVVPECHRHRGGVARRLLLADPRSRAEGEGRAADSGQLQTPGRAEDPGGSADVTGGARGAGVRGRHRPRPH